MPEPAPAPFSIIDVSLDAAEITESLGSKFKFWFTRRNESTGKPERWLFKAVRPIRPPKREPDGDDWAECVAAKVAAALGLPHARYELAQWDLPDGLRRGVITRRIQDRAAGLTHGNELLAEHAADAGYPRTDPNERHFGRTPLYTPELVLDMLAAREVEVPASPDLPDAITTGPELFVGYLLLDALIGNTDRHDENWAVLDDGGRLLLAPTFDHASSLGRELPDSKRRPRLIALAPPYNVASYLDRPRSRFHDADAPAATRRILSPMEAFEAAARVNAGAAAAWTDRLASLPLEQLTAPIGRIPASRITDLGRRFAGRVLAVNRSRLLGD